MILRKACCAARSPEAQAPPTVPHSVSWTASPANQTVSADQVRRSIKEFTGGAVETQKATDAARLTVEDMAKLADGLTASVAQFKLA